MHIGISPDNWKDYFTLERDYEREEKILYYYNIEPDEKYNVINRIFGTPPNIAVNPSIQCDNGFRNIEMEVLSWDRLFDYGLLWERAQEIHIVDSSSTLLLAKLGIKGCNIYERIVGQTKYHEENLNYIHRELFSTDFHYFTSLTKDGMY